MSRAMEAVRMRLRVGAWTALAALFVTGCTATERLSYAGKEKSRTFAPRGRFTYRSGGSAKVTRQAHVELMRSGYANIGEMAVSRPAAGAEIMEYLLTEAHLVGGDLLRVEDIFTITEQAFLEGEGRCVAEQQVKQFLFEYQGYAYSIMRWVCARRGDVATTEERRVIRTTVWRKEPTLAAEQLQIALGGDPAPRLAPQHRALEQLQFCRAGRAEGCERAAQAVPLRNNELLREAQVIYQRQCKEGVPSACAAEGRIHAVLGKPPT